METITINTANKDEIIDITDDVKNALAKYSVSNGICIVYSPHTTAGITINENADPDVKHDVLLSLDDIVKELNFRHGEGNSSAHVKTILTGKSQTLIVKNSKIQLGTWDGIYFCEFDGPRSRKVFVEFIPK